MKTVNEIKEQYTLSKPCLVRDHVDAKTVWIRVGAQSFCIDGYQDSDEEAERMRNMLAKSLYNLIISECPKLTP